MKASDQGNIISTKTGWLPGFVLSACRCEADSKFPNETVGSFMGWRVDDSSYVITAMIGPGSEAHHSPSSFEPNQEWQLERISEHYLASNRRETYLGDWHSHPRASSGDLSWRDRRTLGRVANFKPARCPYPLLLIFWDEQEQWHLSAWFAGLHTRHLFWDTLKLTSSVVREWKMV